MKKVLVVASVVSFIEWFNKENIAFLHEDMQCQVHIACNLNYTEDTDVARTEQYIRKLEQNGVVLHNIPFDRSPFSPKGRKVYRELKKLIQTGNFDLIHCHTPTASMMTRLAARKARREGTTVMYTCHGFHFHKAAPLKNWLLYYPVERFLSRYCDYLLTINREDYRRAQTFHCKNVRYIPSVGIDLQKYRQLSVDRSAVREQLGIGDADIMIISAGELIPRKNHQVIIRALAKLQNPTLHYVIAGKGQLMEELHTLSRQLGVEKQTHLLGFRTDIAQLYGAADIGAFPSRIEGLGMAGIEMMATGLPVVSSNVHGIMDYVKNGVTGFAVPPEDVDGFARAIERLAGDPALCEQMRPECRKAAEPFELHNALQVMWDIYREILK